MGDILFAINLFSSCNMAYVSFYKGAKNAEGDILQKIWKLSNEELETRHNYIQYLFPTLKASRYNIKAPQLTSDEVTQFRSSYILRQRLIYSFDMMMKFFGFVPVKSNNVHLYDYTSNIKPQWLTPANHNYLRMTRMMCSLKLFNIRQEAMMLFIALCHINDKFPDQIDAGTLKIWADAVKDLLTR